MKDHRRQKTAKEDGMERMTVSALDAYPLVTSDKLRYRDTDRQGHVNNAVFSTLLETGRVELLYDSAQPLNSADGCFVIASLHIEFLREITWPGEVKIGTRVKRIGGSSITLEQGLFQSGNCAAVAETVIVQMDEKTRKSMRLEESAIKVLAGLGHGLHR